jgi:hypothetical protein
VRLEIVLRPAERGGRCPAEGRATSSIGTKVKHDDGENRAIASTSTATGATFTDTFGPFEAHVYVISY